MAVGWLTIKSKMDNTGLEKDIEKARAKLQKFSDQETKLLEKDAKLEIDAKKSDAELKRIDDQILKIQEDLKLAEEYFNQGNWSVNFEDTDEFKNMQAEMEQLLQKEDEELTKRELIEQKLEASQQAIDANKASQQALNQEITAMAGELDRANNATRGFSFSDIQVNIKDVEKSVNKVGKGIDKASKKIIRWGLAIFSIRSAFALVRQSVARITADDEQLGAKIEYMKNALASALAPLVERIVNLVWKLMQYLNIIMKAWFNVDLFANTNKSLKGASKGAKDLKKTLAGFDEMNTININTDSGGGGGGVGDFDLSKLDGPVPKWLEFIKDHKDEIIAGILGIGTALQALKWGASIKGATGLGLAIAGVYLAIKGLRKYLKDPSLKNFGKTMEGIGLAVAGVALMFGAWPVALAGALVALTGLLIKHWDKIKAWLQNIQGWLEGKSDWVREIFGNTIGDIYDNIVEWFGKMIDLLDERIQNAKNIFDGVIQFFKGVFAGDWKQAWEELKKIVFGIWDQFVNKWKFVWETLKTTVKKIATSIGGIVTSVFKTAVNLVLGAVEKVINKPIDAINGLIGAINSVPGVSLDKLNHITLPRLAVGGIVNQPGRGVQTGGAIVGEAGREGILPLTDSQAMTELGEAIGRYITINASITNTMNGRVISRELQKVQNGDNFAFNR